MGMTIKAQCECGYETYVDIGQGMMLAPDGGDPPFRAPAWSKYSKHIVISDYSKKGSTAHYRDIIFYNDPRVQAPIEDDDDPRRERRDEDSALDRTGWMSWGGFNLSNIEYLCPKCGEIGMRFRDTGMMWD